MQRSCCVFSAVSYASIDNSNVRLDAASVNEKSALQCDAVSRAHKTGAS
jgi:hypothetical protein